MCSIPSPCLEEESRRIARCLLHCPLLLSGSRGCGARSCRLSLCTVPLHTAGSRREQRNRWSRVDRAHAVHSAALHAPIDGENASCALFSSLPQLSSAQLPWGSASQASDTPHRQRSGAHLLQRGRRQGVFIGSDLRGAWGSVSVRRSGRLSAAVSFGELPRRKANASHAQANLAWKLLKGFSLCHPNFILT
jgi:hypothetical protein